MLAIFDQTFAITTALNLLASVVAFIGILSALMALQLERTREFGTMRANIQNMVLGVTNGFSKVLEIVGTGYRAQMDGKKLVLQVGFSHPVVFKLPEGVSAEVDAKQTRIVVKSADKHLLGLTSAKIRGLRLPEPYKGKGIKYATETIRRKEGKTGAA